jgi:hypothetical protein
LYGQQNLSLPGESPASPAIKKATLWNRFALPAWQIAAEAAQNLLSYQ